MGNDQPTRKAVYRSPEIADLGNAAELTLGNGDVHPDFLGNPLTKYGQWGQPEAGESEEEISETEESEEDEEEK